MATLAQATSNVGYTDTNATEVVFILMGLLAIGSAVLVVTTRNVVRAALWLVVTLAAAAGCYLILAAEFVAWVQVLIYVGAVVVLLLFGIMLTKAPIGREQGLDGENRIAAGVVGIASAATLVTLMVDAFRHQFIDLENSVPSTTERTGEALFQAYVLPFEVVSVLLLAALIGSIVLSRRDDDEGVR